MGNSWLEEDELPLEKVETRLHVADIIPKQGNYLGLDISKNSTGICLIQNGEKVTGNITLSKELIDIKNSKDWCFQEVLLRRLLKKYLSEVIQGINFDVIIIEDAFSGENPKVVRMLYALNTAIDEMILDGVCTCKEFRRVSNGSWKHWLWKELDKEGVLTGLNDKVKIQRCLSKIGIDEGTSEGFQDRLDATGMLIGYFLNKDEILEDDTSSGVKVSWSQLDFAFEIDEFFIYDGREWLHDLPVVYIKLNKVTKKAILEEVNKAPSCLFITDDLVYLGLMADKLGVENIDGGYLAIWVKKRNRKKLFGD